MFQSPDPTDFLQPREQEKTDLVQLVGENWNKRILSVLNREFELGSFYGRTIASDHDNSMICGDCGEATFELLVRKGLLKVSQLSPALGSPLGIKLSSEKDLFDFYKNFGSKIDADIDINVATKYVYRWIVRVMEGLSVADVVQTAQEAVIASGLKEFSRPYPYPEMIELMLSLKKAGADIWVVSASNPWSVRASIEEFFNPALRAHGLEPILPRQVIGLGVRIRDGAMVYDDRELIREDPDYANGVPARLEQLILTSEITEPAATFGGKRACCEKILPSRPIFVIGDSDNDLAMMEDAELKLLIGRNSKLVKQIGARLDPSWLIQPVYNVGSQKNTLAFCP